MHLDLNVSYPPANSSIPMAQYFSSMFSSLFQFGYDGIAWATPLLSGRITQSESKSYDEFPIIPPMNNSPLSIVDRSFLRVSSSSTPFPSNFKQFSRINIKLTDSQQMHSISSSNSALLSYDLVAVQPMTESLFHSACSSDSIDIIIIDCMERLPYFIKRPAIHLAKSRGISFELNYSPALRDYQNRKFLFSQSQQLIRLLNDNLIIFSSGAQRFNDLRSPKELINLLIIMGFNEISARKIICENPRTVILHGEARKSIKSIIRPTPLRNLLGNNINKESEKEGKSSYNNNKNKKELEADEDGNIALAASAEEENAASAADEIGDGESEIPSNNEKSTAAVASFDNKKRKADNQQNQKNPKHQNPPQNSKGNKKQK